MREGGRKECYIRELGNKGEKEEERREERCLTCILRWLTRRETVCSGVAAVQRSSSHTAAPESSPGGDYIVVTSSLSS